MNRIARWSGDAWSAMGSGMNGEVYALVSDGVGNIHAGGGFTTAGDKFSHRLGWWSDVPCDLPAAKATNDAMLRDTMAEWLGKCVHGHSHTPPTYSGIYSDVLADDYNADWIGQIFNDGITEGCDDGTIYCPRDPVTKRQAVKLILRAEHGDSYSPPMARTPPFIDIPLTHPDVDWIKQAEYEGVTTGCGDGWYFCPSEVLTGKSFLKMLDGAF